MRPIILRTATTYLVPLLLLFSIFLLVRGHNEPGGGFAGGLVAAAAFILLSIATSISLARRTLRIDPRSLIGVGLVLMIVAGFVGPVLGDPYLTARWWSVALPGGNELALGTPLFFDVGVYLAVAGTILAIAFALEEEPA